MKVTGLLITLFFVQTVWAAPYYRFWRGQKLSHLEEKTYLNHLASQFVPLAPQLFPALTSYLVAVPPQGLGVDEVALLAYTNEEDYLRGRSTQDGRAYGDAHWDLFERETSGSLVPGPLLGAVQANKAYDLLQRDLDWGKGATHFYIGQKKSLIPTANYLKALDIHVRRVRAAFAPLGLLGHVVLVTPDRVYSWMNWRSAGHAASAYTTSTGHALMNEATTIMDTLQWSAANRFKGELKRGNAFHVRTR